jgi:creatinine deaminase
MEDILPLRRGMAEVTDSSLIKPVRAGGGENGMTNGGEDDVDEDLAFLRLAVEQARIGREEGGIPIGAALVVDGEVRGVGRNRRVQMGSAIRHGETDCLENIGRLPASTYRRSTLYTTLSPCTMCAGTVVLYGIPRVVIGENRTFEASEQWLRANGVEVVVLDEPECVDLMTEFIAAEPALWNEDIGVEDAS